MPWFKVDDALAFHMKAIGAGNGALGLWVRAGSWSMQQLTDGFIPSAIVTALGGGPDDAPALVGVGLWHSVDGGYQFHDWAEYQPTREQVLAERAAATERKRVSREKSRQRSQRESHRDARGTDAVIPASPTRPDPTLSTSVEVESAPSATLSPFCSKHPQGTDKACRPCGTARMAFEAARAAEKNKPTPMVRRPKTCTVHAEYPMPCPRCAEEAMAS